MSTKARKSLCPWVTCDKCHATLAQKDTPAHAKNCPPLEYADHAYIKDGILNTTVDVYKSTEVPKNVSTQEFHNMAFMSESALQLCQIPIGDPVVIRNKETVVVKTAWPMTEKSLTTVYLTKNAVELNKLEGPVQVEKLRCSPVIATEFIVEPVGKHSTEKLSTELYVLIKNYNHGRIFTIGNRVGIPYYGKKLIFKIMDVKTDVKLEDQLSSMVISNNAKVEKTMFISLYSSKWTVLLSAEQKEETKKQKRHRLECIGGYSNLIEDLKDVFNIGLGKYGDLDNFHISKGILLYGPSGVGKSMISEALLSEVEAHVININSADIYSKSFRDTETVLNNLFQEAFKKAPSIILIEDIDSLCPKKNTSITDHEKRVLATLITLFDSLQDDNKRVMILALTSKLDAVDSSLRRPGRIDREFEMPVPTRQIRREILLKIIEKMPHALNDQDIDQISYETHGFVGADLHGLCSQAAMNAIKTRSNSGLAYDSNKILVTRQDFNHALNLVNPSAMKEVLVDVPNVQWTDIGGQKDLKLKLVQAVEWPLKHPEVFTRLGIVPPKGVLMFGPPGCSKTMIAKAVATESKLNFLNIKGPELFSKWVGESEKAVRELFRKARQVAPSIIFIDEMDAIGVERSTSSSSAGSSVQERVLAQLLTELDGVTALGNVTLIGATNRPDRIDKALLRPGRFDRLIYVPLPDAETRLDIFNIKLRKMPISKDVDLKDLVDLTEGYSGAEIQAICHEAGMRALEENLDAAQVTKEHFRVALSIVVPRTHKDVIKVYEDFVQKS
ncbi:hypothetical protein QAD02_000635 [Eretmocerus hayati]|uniref:Uncharacterized protein n=1 Tax=Eretmocerus hayati TaxID=131215 RepID=A0ACC2NEQ8_9HYME|nr:hypothetical protein QAD02_000635 [Eretmocerus hayati]